MRRLYAFFLRLLRGVFSLVLGSLDESEERPRGDHAIAVHWLDSRGAHRTKEAEVVRHTATHIVVEMAVPLEVTREVGILGDAACRAVVVECKPGVDGYVLTLSRVQKEERRFDRVETSGKATLTWRATDGTEHMGKVEIRNLSEGGLQIACANPIPVPEVVRIEGERIGCLGSTCYCHQVGEEYLVGLQFVQRPFLKKSLDYEED